MQYTRTIAAPECTGASPLPRNARSFPAFDHLDSLTHAFTPAALILLCRWLVVPLLHTFTKDDPEASHKFAIKVLASGLSPVDIQADQEDVLGFDVSAIISCVLICGV